jgi:hypothetical protein
MTKKLEILIASLEKKEAMFNQKLDDNIATVKQANGQPLNDKRNGRATLNKWESQNNSLKSLQLEIEKTKRAIENETAKIKNVEHTQNILPSQIIDLISEGTLIQWRKYPNMFFVEGVEIARIIWNAKKKRLGHKYFNLVIDIEQRKKFANIFNQLYNSLR